jgi:hypothetical protein
MKLSQNTIQILKNYASINQNILFRTGNTLKTVDQTKPAVYSKATIEESFERDFGIYDLSKFISTLSLFDDPELEIGDKFITISQGERKVNYTLASPELIICAPNKDIIIPDVISSFDFKKEQLQEFRKAMSILNMSEMVIEGSNGVISILTQHTKNTTTDVYSVKVGTTDLEFRAVVDSERIKLLDRDYMIEVSSKGYIRLSDDTIEYFIGCNPNLSKF